jgi:hypothetical protein
VNFEPTAIVGLESCLFFNNFIINRLLVSLILITGIFKGLIQVAGYWLSRAVSINVLRYQAASP